MPVSGNLASMSLTDLLQWAGRSSKTGTLELERNGVRKRIHFRKGRLTSCSSDDPATLLGQFLLSRGKITTEQLRDGLAAQHATGESLGKILVGKGVLTPAELKAQIAAKAEETVFGLFDWPDASFRFDDETPPDPYGIEVDLLVEDVLLHGLKRYDEMRRLREAFPDRTLVLRRTGQPLPPEVSQVRAAREIFESIDGTRSLEEILLHAHATEYVALQFLYQLKRHGLIEIPQAPGARGAEHPPAPGPAAPPPAGGGPGAAAPGIGARIADALEKLAGGDPESALEILSAAHRDHPGEASLRALIGKAETAFREAAMRIVGPAKIPVIAVPPEHALRQGLSPLESYLLTVIDGKNDVRSILWVAPLRELDVLRGLKRLHERGIIQFR